MIKPATILLALIALALLGRLDRDGLLARGNLLAARVLGYELRLEVSLLRTSADAAIACPPVGPSARRPVGSSERPCE